MNEMAARIQEGYARDQARGVQPVTSASELPLAYEAITDEWLTDALCRNVPGAKVTGHTLGPADNGSSNRRKIGVEYNEAGRAAKLPEKIFCKASHDLANRFFLGLAGAVESETNFYRFIRPHLSLEAPVGIYTGIDLETFNSLVMLVDISDDVTQFCDHRTKMSRFRAESQIKNLARLHGSSVSNPQIQAEFKRFLDWPTYFRRCTVFGLKDGSEAGFQDGREIIPARLFARAEEVWPATLASVELHDHLPQSFCHGDVHLKNWYVAGNGEMGLSDWQCTNIGHWSRDLAYTMSTSLAIEDRRLWERELIALYIEELAIHGGGKVTFDEALLRYRQQLMTALTWWTITLHPSPGLPDMQPRDTTVEFVRRIATAVDDNESLDSFST